MNLTVLKKQVRLFAGSIIVLLVAYTLSRQLGLYAWTAHEAEGLAVLLQLIGDIYAVLLAFMIFVIWTQFTEVENCVIREADSLHDLLRYAAMLNDDGRAAVRKAVFNYVRRVTEREWEELAEGRKDSQAADAFSRLLVTVVEIAPKNELVREHLLEAVRTASMNRNERVAKSLTRMPPTLSGLVKLIAAVLLLLLFVYPFHDPLAGADCIVVATLVLFAANFVMTDTDNPLKGLWNVRIDPFTELPH